jgi:hypothetical protein
MAEVGAPWPVMGELVGEGREGDGEGERLVRWGCQGGCRRGQTVGGRLSPGYSVLSPCS